MKHKIVIKFTIIEKHNKMMIKYSFRGTVLELPKHINEHLNDEEDNSEIYLDVNPEIIYLLQFSNLNDLDDIDNFLHQDLLYLNLIKNQDTMRNFDIKSNSCTHFNKWWKSYPIKDYTYNKENIPKKIIINTIDNHKIIVHGDNVSKWFDCYFKDIIVGKYDKYIVNKNLHEIELFIYLESKYLHNFLSLMRDGINNYYDDIINDKKFRNLLLDYKMIDYYDYHTMIIRQSRCKNILKYSNSFKIKDNKLTLFDNKEEESEKIYIKHKNKRLYIRLNLIDDNEVSKLWNKLRKQIKYHDRNKYGVAISYEYIIVQNDDMNKLDEYLNNYFLGISY